MMRNSILLCRSILVFFNPSSSSISTQFFVILSFLLFSSSSYSWYLSQYCFFSISNHFSLSIHSFIFSSSLFFFQNSFSSSTLCLSIFCVLSSTACQRFFFIHFLIFVLPCQGACSK